MDAVLLARLQFALTICFHFIFPPLTIGLAWLIFWFMDRYRRSGEPLALVQARFWIRLFAVSFVLGVATGITMEFQFGTNWADYSRFVGDIFGAPLAAEGILAFFLESTFVGVLLFGWRRLSQRALWCASLMVAIGATLSAFWIIVANSWMQTPAGYQIVDGHAELTDFWAAVFNPSTIPRFLHTIDACLITGAFFMMGISAWYLWKRRHVALARQSLKVALVVGFIAAFLQLPLGHWHAVQVAETQPLKLAAFEGLFESGAHAPLTIFGIPDGDAREVRAAVKIPSGLSLLVHGNPQGFVPGLDQAPPEEWPPLGWSFFPFHLMFVLGLFFIALTGLGLILWRVGRLFENDFFLKLAFLTWPWPIIANELGWIAAEVGRQPWIVYQVPGMRTDQAISPSVSAGEILATMILFGALYVLFFVLWVHLLRREVGRGPEREGAAA